MKYKSHIDKPKYPKLNDFSKKAFFVWDRISSLGNNQEEKPVVMRSILSVFGMFLFIIYGVIYFLMIPVIILGNLDGRKFDSKSEKERYYEKTKELEAVGGASAEHTDEMLSLDDLTIILDNNIKFIRKTISIYGAFETNDFVAEKIRDKLIINFGTNWFFSVYLPSKEKK